MSEPSEKSAESTDTNKDSNEYQKRILIKKDKDYVFVDLEDVFWISSSGNYLKLNLKDTSHLIRGTLASIKVKLNPKDFIQVHRSSIVNIRKAKRIQQLSTGDYKVILKNGETLKMSRNFRKVLDYFSIK